MGAEAPQRNPTVDDVADANGVGTEVQRSMQTEDEEVNPLSMATHSL